MFSLPPPEDGDGLPILPSARTDPPPRKPTALDPDKSGSGGGGGHRYADVKETVRMNIDGKEETMLVADLVKADGTGVREDIVRWMRLTPEEVKQIMSIYHAARISTTHPIPTTTAAVLPPTATSSSSAKPRSFDLYRTIILEHIDTLSTLIPSDLAKTLCRQLLDERVEWESSRLDSPQVIKLLQQIVAAPCVEEFHPVTF